MPHPQLRLPPEYPGHGVHDCGQRHVAEHPDERQRAVLGFRFRTSNWQHYMEDLESFESRVNGWEKTSGDLLSDSIMQAIVKENTPEKIRQQIETASFVSFRELKRSLVTTCLTEISRLPDGGGLNYLGNGKGQEKCNKRGKMGHRAADCCSGGKGKQKGKDGGKGKTKGGKFEKSTKGKKGVGGNKPEYFDGACSNCGKWGHKKKDCWSDKMQVNQVAGSTASGAESVAGAPSSKGSGGTGSVYAIVPHVDEPGFGDGWIMAVSGKTEKWTIDKGGATRGLVDSVAWTMVCPEAFASGFPLKGSGGSGTLKSCSGTVVKQYGTVKVPVKLFDRDGEPLAITITFVVADVDQVILSVFAFSTLGFSSVLGAEGGYLHYGGRFFDMTKDNCRCRRR